ncbi:MAG: hypothetical protein KC516_00910 [Nanoarchaeota archaeon]|nr:hypothetical protein [Nanoarchaeota archaeon]
MNFELKAVIGGLICFIAFSILFSLGTINEINLCKNCPEAMQTSSVSFYPLTIILCLAIVVTYLGWFIVNLAMRKSNNF